MDYSIYTFGGGEILWKVFNGIAILFKSESHYFTPVLKLSATIGALWAALRAVFGYNIGLFARDWFLPTYLLITVLFVPKTSVHIIDVIDADHRYTKVDHIPIGLAAIASTASVISKEITEKLEAALSSDDSLKYSHVGPLFAAKLMTMSRDQRIIDPVHHDNIKDFVRQCFTWPFIFTNIKPGRKAALDAHDILGFIEASPHPWLGSYWRAPDGSSEFLYCRQGCSRVREVLNVERPQGLAKLALGLFGGSSQNPDIAKNRLERHFGHAWEELAGMHQSAHEIVGQQMLINAYRDGLDDKREEFGLTRTNPYLISYAATRGDAQQNTGFLVTARMAGQFMPSLQVVLFSLSILLFAFIVPMSMLPGGLKLFGNWIKIMLWVQSWPAFFAILNCLGHMFAARASATALLGTSGGLSILTQNGLSDAAYDAYCYTEGLQVLAPFISWAVITGGGYAMSSLASTLTQSAQGLASKMGSDIADGNISFDTQSFHNRTIGSHQYAQQQLSPSFNFASRIDDGAMALTYGATGSVVAQSQMSSMATNVTSSDSLAASASSAFQESSQLSAQSLLGLADRLSHGRGLSQNLSQQESADIRATADAFQRAAQDFAKQHNISAQTAADLALRGHMGARFDGGLVGSVVKGLLGAQGSAGIEGSMGKRVEANNQELLNKALNTGAGKALTESASNLVHYAQSHSSSISDNESRELADQLNRSYTQARNWSKVQSLAENKSISSSTNETDNVLQYLADQKFGGDKALAALWANEHRQAYESIASEFMGAKSEALKGWVNSTDHVLSEGEIERWMDRSGFDYNGMDKDQFDDIFNNQSRHVASQLNKTQQEIESLRTEITQQQEALESEHNHQHSKGNRSRAFKKMRRDFKGT